MKVFKKTKIEEVFLILVVVIVVLSAVSAPSNAYTSKTLTSVQNYNISNNSNISIRYNNFNNSLNCNINATKNLSTQYNLPFYVGNLTSKIKSSFNAFLPIENILHNSTLYNDFSWGIDHNFTDNITFAEFSITFNTGENVTMFTWQANESKPLMLELNVKILPEILAATSATTTNWSGYEVYDAANEVTQVSSPITVSSITTPPVSDLWGACYSIATAAWVGLSNEAGGKVQIAQTGYVNLLMPKTGYYYSIPYYLFYEVVNNNNNAPSNPTSYYPNAPVAGPGYTYSFSVQNTGTEYTFAALNLSNSKESYTASYTPKTIDKTYYSEFIVEAPTPTFFYNKFDPCQLGEFSSPISFTYPELYTTTWYYVGSFYPTYWNEYYMNQAQKVLPYNVNIFNSWSTTTYYYTMTWNNSDYSLFYSG
jgi:hypothetical protein